MRERLRMGRLTQVTWAVDWVQGRQEERWPDGAIDSNSRRIDEGLFNYRTPLTKS